MTNPTPLSPAAQAVAQAYDNAPERPAGNHRYHWIAAALRAAAERNEYKPDMRDEMEVMFSEGWNSHRSELLAIADELDQPTP